MVAVTLVLFGAVCVWDFRRVKNFRAQWLDGLMGLFCAVPFFSALANGFSFGNAFGFLFEQLCAWGIPYLLGRLYLTDLNALRDLALGIVIGGLVYAPLCWYEIFFGPVLHAQLYGFPPSALEMAVRFGGWRPLVFQLHGLMVGLFMAAATVCAFWLWYTRAASHVWKLPLLWIFLVLASTTLAVKSVNGWVLAGAGILFLWSAARLPMAHVLRALFGLVAAYLGLRVTGLWDARQVSALGRMFDGKEMSLYYRVVFENLIAARTRAQWLWGWGSNARAMVRSYLGHVETVSDSYWIAVYGMWGIVGLSLWLLVFVAPLLYFVKKFSASLWRRSDIAPAAAVLTIVLMYWCDALLNTMPNPIYVFALGGIAAVSFARSDFTRPTA
jgi:hypothetical protein